VRRSPLLLSCLVATGCVALASESREDDDPRVPVMLPPVEESQPAPAPVAARPTSVPRLPVQPGQQWSGQYVCMAGPTDVNVRIERVQGTTVDAVFELATGRYGLSGQYDPESGALDLQPTGWLTEAPGVPLVGLYGTVTSETVYEGRVTDAMCRWFSLRRRS